MKTHGRKYLEVVEWIDKKIQSREFPPGSKIYSENELSEMFQLSRQTIRHAISVLEQKKLITRVKGSGTYINENLPFHIKREKTMNIAVISTYVDGYIFPNIIKGIEKVLSKEGYMVQIAFTNNRVDRERVIIQNILAKNSIDGLIVEATKSAIPNPNIMFYEELLNRKVPIIFFNSYYPELKAPHVTIDDRKASRKATQYLIQKGHKRIAAILKSDDGQGHLRYAGYIEAMLEAGLTLNDTNIIWLDTEDVKNIRSDRKVILNRMRNCTAVFCYNDEIAFSLVEMCQLEGVAIPEQLSVIGIDNSELTELSDIPITSVPHPMEELGTKTAENLIYMIQDEGYDGNYEFEAEVVERASVKFM